MGARRETVRAKIGATILDVMRPGWADEVDPETLDLGDCEACVLGQLFGRYSIGAEKLFAMRNTGTVPTCSSISCGVGDAAYEAGFDASSIDDPDKPILSYSNLTAAWRREIAKRTGRAA